MRFAWIATVGEEPVGVVADAVAALFEAAVVLADGLVGVGDHARGRIGEDLHHIGVGGGAVGLERQQIVAAAAHDGLGDGGLGSHGVDGDERALELQPFEQQRNGGDLVGFGVGRLLAEHQALARCPGRDHVQRFAAFGPGMRPP